MCVFFWHCSKKKQKSLVRLNLSTRTRLNFQLTRKALKSPVKFSRKLPLNFYQSLIICLLNQWR